MFKENRGRGYEGKSMSVNARAAHSNSEMPLSHWTKKRILEELEEYEELNLNLIKKLTKDQLQELVLNQTSWHHTGALYNITLFYSIDEDFLPKLTDEFIQGEIDKRKAHLEATKEERAAKRAQEETKREERRAEKAFGEELEELLSFSSYKTLNGLRKAVEAGRVDLDKLRLAKEAQVKEREERRFKAIAGQIRKQTSYKNTQDMLEDYKAGKMAQEVKDLMNSKLNFPEF